MLERSSPDFGWPEGRDRAGHAQSLPDQREGRDRDPALAAIEAEDRKGPMVLATIGQRRRERIVVGRKWRPVQLVRLEGQQPFVAAHLRQVLEAAPQQSLRGL